MKLLKNKRALSPVVVSIILIAVMVAVSIVVAAWMGALIFSFRPSKTYGLQVTRAEFPAPNLITLTIENNGTGWVQVTYVYINNERQIITFPELFLSLDPGETKALNITYSWTSGYNYHFKTCFTRNSGVNINLDPQYYYKDFIAPTR